MRKSFTRFLSLLFVFCLFSISTIVNAQETQKTVELNAEDVTACYNASNEYVVKVSMRDFISLVRFHLVLDYSEGVFNFKGVTGVNANISTLAVTESPVGTINLDWTSATPVTFADNVMTGVATLHFGINNFPNNLANSYVSPLTWTSTDFYYKPASLPSEIVNTDNSVDGKLTVNVGISNLQVSVGTVSCAGGDAVGTVTSPAQGTGYTYLFNEDPDPTKWTWTANASYSAPSNTTNTVRVKDANGCISLPKSFSIADLAPVTYTASKQDATCKGGNGELQINAVGGTGPYTYWVIPDANFAAVQPTLVNNAAKTAALSDYKKINFQILRPAGVYHVAVDDVNLCRDLSNAAYWTTLTIGEPASAVAVALGTINGETCADADNGSIAVSVSGGTAAGEYKVSTNGGLTWFTTVEGGYTFTNLTPGTYVITAMDDNGCKSTSSNAVVAAKAPITFDLSIVDTSCGGDVDGQIAVSNIAGGTSPYTLVIKDATTTTTQAAVVSAFTFTGLGPHYYSLTITDANGCVATYNNPNGTGNVIAVQSPADIKFIVVKANVPCNGGNGTLTVNATGGSGSYLYGLNGVYATPNTNVFSVPAGTYDISVKNASGAGCEVTQSEITVTEPDVLTASIDHVLPPTCIDGSDGNIYVNIDGGTSPYYYSINNGSWVMANSSLAIIKATVGTHSINIKDSNGCTIESALSQTVTQNEDVITATPSKVITCFGATDDAVINVTVESWASDLMAPPAPTGFLSAPAPRIIQYKYSTSEATANTGTGFTPGVTHFAAGTYWIGAVDQFGCMATPVKVVVEQNPALVITSVIANGASCYGTFGGTITVQATGGTLLPGQKLQYALLNSQAGLDNITPDKWLDFQTYDAETMLSTVSFQVEKGTYWIAVKDGNCVNNLKTYGPISVDGYDKLLVKESSIVVANVNCNGELNGSINVPMSSVSGGAGAYMFTLLNGSGTPIIHRIQQATGLFAGLGVGTYKVLVEDSEGCPTYTTASITITEPSVLSFTTSKTYFTCNNSNDGLITINVAGGTSPYYYAINNVNTWVAFTGTSKTYVATEPGVFKVWVKDAHGCVTGPTEVEILQPSVIVPTVHVVNNVLCNGSATGKITVSATGGWDEMSVYSYKVDNGAWGNAASIAALGLANGNHILYVKDIATYSNPYVNASAGCVYSVAFYIDAPKAIAYNVSLTNVKCKGGADGTFTVTVDGTTGTPWTGNLNDALNGYDVTLTGNAYYQVIRTGSDNTVTFTGLNPSFYTVHITDMNGCTLKATVGNTTAPYTTVESWEVAEPDMALTISGEWKKDATCFGSTDGQFVINAAGGIPPYKYYAALSIEPNGHILTPAPPVEGSNQWQDSNVFNVGAGTWVIWTIDSNGCMIGGETKNGIPYNPWRVKIAQPAEVTWAFHMMPASPVDTIHYKMPSCFGKEDGQIHLVGVAGGNGGPYTAIATGTSADGVAKVYTQVITQSSTAPFLWIINNVAASDANGYTVKVVDGNGCESTSKKVVIKQPKLLGVTLAKGDDQFTCPDAVEGFIEASAMGGTKPYTYSLYKDGVLHTADVTPSAFLVQIGHTFMVEVKDANGCTATSSITINPVLPVEVKLAETTCYSDVAASVVVSATGEAGRTFSVRYKLNTDASYSDWLALDSNNQRAITGLKFANVTETENFYYFQVKDSKGCEKDTLYSFVPTQHPLEATVVQSADQLSASLTITGGVSPYSYKVGDGDMVNLPVDGDTFQVVNLMAPQTVVTVYDAHGCMVAKPIVVDPVSVTAVPALGNNMERTFSVVLTFNRDVTVPDGGITVTGGDAVITGSGKVYTVAVTADDLADISIALANTIGDAAGNMLTAKTFTYKVGDHVAPTVVVTDPATPVATVFTVGLKFSEPVSGVLDAVTVTGGTLTDVSGLGDTYTLKVSATEQTAVTIVIANTISDLSANANKFAGLTLNYTTGDFTKPQIVTMAPSDGATTTDNHPTFTMTFSENVMVGAGGSLKVYKVNTTTLAMPAIPITADMISGKNVTVSYAATQTGLDKDTRYYVLVDGTALEDNAGNTFDGVSDVAAWTFKTGPDFATVIDPTQNGSLEFKVYPNPFVDYVTVSNASKLAKVVVTNIAGQVVKEVVNPTDRIQLNELRSGVYFISMYKSNNVITQTAKIVKR